MGRAPLTLVALHSSNDELPVRVHAKAYLKVVGARESALEQIVTRLSFEPGVTAVSREVAAADPEDASPAPNGELARAE